MADTHVNVGAPAETWSDVVNVVVHVLVNARLEAERSDDAGVVVLLAGLDEFLTQFKRLFQERLTDGGRVVTHHRHFRDLLVNWHGHLLRSRQSDVTVQRGFETPVNAEEFQSFALLRQRAVKEIEVEHGADDIALNSAFLSFGTNDLTQMTYGLSRDDAGRFMSDYVQQGVFPEDPFHTLDIDGVGELLKMGVTRARDVKSDILLSICGEHGGSPESIAFCRKIGMDYVSCSPFRVPVAKLAAAQLAIKDRIDTSK